MINRKIKTPIKGIDVKKEILLEIRKKYRKKNKTDLKKTLALKTDIMVKLC